MEGFIGIKEASVFLGIKASTLYSWKSRGLIPCYKPSGDKGIVLFKLSELEHFVEDGRINNGDAI